MVDQKLLEDLVREVESKYEAEVVDTDIQQDGRINFSLSTGKVVQYGVCVICEGVIRGREDFRDDLSWKEYHISHLCQSCQDKVFDQDIDTIPTGGSTMSETFSVDARIGVGDDNLAFNMVREVVGQLAEQICDEWGVTLEQSLVANVYLDGSIMFEYGTEEGYVLQVKSDQGDFDEEEVLYFYLLDDGALMKETSVAIHDIRWDNLELVGSWEQRLHNRVQKFFGDHIEEWEVNPNCTITYVLSNGMTLIVDEEGNGKLYTGQCIVGDTPIEVKIPENR